MTHIVHCVKLNKSAEGLAKPPIGGELGQKIYDNISQEAWALWQARQTMIINENRLNVVDPKARARILQEMETFLFGDGGEAPAGYTPPEVK